MKFEAKFTPDLQAAYDADLAILESAKHRWAQTTIGERVAQLQLVKKNLMEIAENWVEAAGMAKGWAKSGYPGPIPSCPVAMD